MSSPRLNGGFSGPGGTYVMALAPNDRSGENILPLHLDNNDHVKCAVCGANEPQVHVKSLRSKLGAALRKRYSGKEFTNQSYVCLAHLVDVLTERSNQLFEEDAVERGRFQVSKLPNFGNHVRYSSSLHFV
ncbi:hypothetical protein M427DRAFT_59476, partial [Gonapodya prolifera JEL478]